MSDLQSADMAFMAELVANRHYLVVIGVGYTSLKKTRGTAAQVIDDARA